MQDFKCFSEAVFSDVKETAKRIYGLFLNPKYMTRKVLTIRSLEDLKFASKGAKKVLGHIKDFTR